jgi:flagellar basal body-associated protein FliL
MPPQAPKSRIGNILVIILLVSALVVALGFGVWAFNGRQDYKNNVDKKVAVAVASAKTAQAAALKQQFNEQSKSPYKTFKGAIAYGTISFNYPKTWSAYVDESSTSAPINGYFYPDQVPAVQGITAFALRLELVDSPYDQVLQQYSSQITAGTLRAAAYVPPKMKSVANVQPGTKLDGAIGQNQQGPVVGSMVIIKVRDKTLKIYTQSTNFSADFNNVILTDLTFVP